MTFGAFFNEASTSQKAQPKLFPITTSDLTGVLGSSFRGQVGYETPRPKGPGAKTYVLTLFALSAKLKIIQPLSEVDFLTGMDGMRAKTLSISCLYMSHTRLADSNTPSPPPPRPSPNPGAPPGMPTP